MADAAIDAQDEVRVWLAKYGLDEVPLERLLQLATSVDELGFLRREDLSALALRPALLNKLLAKAAEIHAPPAAGQSERPQKRLCKGAPALQRGSAWTSPNYAIRIRRPTSVPASLA